MPDGRNCGCGCSCGCGNNNGILGGCGDDCSILFFIIIFLIFTIIFMFNLEYKAKNLNDFYIVTGEVKDIIKRTEYCYDDTYHHYIYLIDNNEKEINTDCYRKFNYENLKK